MYKYKMILSYDGTRYSGWQIQPNAPSIQEEIEKHLATILQEKITLHGSGRTDGGVHAVGQTAHFETQKQINEKKILLSLNGLLPWDIRVKSLIEVSQDFHARFSAKEKVYHYHFWKEPVIDPMFFPYRLHMIKPIDFSLVKKACQLFIGKKDFTTFANLRQSNQVLKNPVRELKSLELVEQEGGYRLEFVGDGFLYKMVRNIVGVLIEVGQARREIESISELFDKKDRKVIGAPAPARGLFLERVIY